MNWEALEHFRDLLLKKKAELMECAERSSTRSS